MLVSVIMPTYNRANIIEKAIQSVLFQEYINFELIIIDDGSRDNTKSVIDAIFDNRIRYICLEDNHGSSHARNIGMKAAHGEYIAFLDSDNTWNISHLKRRMERILQMNRNAMVFGSMWAINGEEKSVFPGVNSDNINDRDELIRLMMLSNRIDTNTVVISKSACNRIGEFDESLPPLEDWDYFFKAVRDKEIDVAYDEIPSVYHYLSSDSISRNKGVYLSNRLAIFENNIDLLNEFQDDGEADYDMEFISGYSFNELDKMIDQIRKEKKDILIKYLTWTLKKQNASWFGVNEKWKRAEDGWHKTFMDWMKASDNVKLCDGILTIEEKLQKLGVKRIGIYGYGKYGKMLEKQLNNSSIDVVRIIDKNFTDNEVTELKVKTISESDNCDVIIVSILASGEEITSELKQQTSTPVYWIANM